MHRDIEMPDQRKPKWDFEEQRAHPMARLSVRPMTFACADGLLGTAPDCWPNGRDAAAPVNDRGRAGKPSQFLGE
jgi:hypothetical protein